MTTDLLSKIYESETEKCEFCREARKVGAMCNVAYDGFYCTRAKGHSGPHAACGLMQHPIKTWPAKIESSSGVS